jgi:hypothetical protein
VTATDLRAKVRDVPDFPKEGIVFKDLMPLIGDAEAFKACVDLLADWARPREPAVILGAEARGFIFGGALAYALGCGFVPARKPGKLPWTTVEATYELEYGQDTLPEGIGHFPDRPQRLAFVGLLPFGLLSGCSHGLVLRGETSFLLTCAKSMP